MIQCIRETTGFATHCDVDHSFGIENMEWLCWSLMVCMTTVTQPDGKNSAKMMFAATGRLMILAVVTFTTSVIAPVPPVAEGEP